MMAKVAREDLPREEMLRLRVFTHHGRIFYRKGILWAKA